MVLNQIDLAKARVRHEKEQMKEFQKAAHGNEMCYQEPNAVTEDELRPPGDEDTGNILMEFWEIFAGVLF